MRLCSQFVPVSMPAKLTKKQIQEGLNDVPMDVLLLGHRSSSLTSKQKAFAKNVALGDTGAEAYRKAYNTKAKPKTVGDEAGKLKKNPVIATEIEAIKEAIEFNKSHSTAQLRALVVSQLTKEALNGENPPASRLTALKALGEVAGVDAFIHRTETKVIRDSDSARTELMEQLKKIMGDNLRTIDQEDDTDARELLAEIAGGGFENQDVATPLEGHPQESTVRLADHLHSIPDNRLPTPDGEGVQNSKALTVNTFEENTPLSNSNK
jgi:hypothetical protein